MHEIGPYVESETLNVKHPLQLLEEIYAPSRNYLLDFGCGQGNHRSVIEQIGYRWHGVDYLDGVAMQAKGRVTSAADIKLYDGRTLPLGDAFFDAVFSFLAFEHIQHIDSTFSEIALVFFGRGGV